MAKFALLVSRDQAVAMDVEPDLVDQTCDVLRSLGHSDADARRLIDATIESGEKFNDVETLLNAVYQQTR
jgi:Holliday junction DNA helicase RuvA